MNPKLLLKQKELEMVTKHFTRTGMGRGLRMGKLGFGLAGSYLGYQLQNLFLNDHQRRERKSFPSIAALQVRKELQSLKGPAMKLGQMLSMQSQILPNEMVTELAQLQLRAPAMHPTLARAQFKASFGKSPEDVFREFAPEPFAAASLGQVHRAVTKSGRSVAVKIQYPAIRSAIENDFKLLRSAALPARIARFTSEAILDELEQGILKETDYLNEGRNIEFFREALKPLPYVRVPDVIWDLTTERILTMSLVPGEPLTDFLAQRSPSQEQRNQIGARLLTLFAFQLRRIYALHADPHPGNYLIDADGTIGMVDFGCVKHFSPEFRELIRCFEARAWVKSEDQTRRMVQLIWGSRIWEQPQLARRLLKATLDFYETLFPSGPAARVDFGDGKVLKTMTRVWRESAGHRAVNPEYVFYGRAELGLYNVLHQLRSKIDTAAALECLGKPRG